MRNGKNFNLFLMDGEVTGRIKCTLGNWIGIAYKIPRIDLEKSKEIQYLNNSGVYFLLSRNKNDELQVYIGQADVRNDGTGVLSRIIEHSIKNKEKEKDEEYFSEAVILTTQNNSFGKTEISYLENRFTSLAKETARYYIINKNTPNRSNVTEEKELELEDFIEYSKIVLGILGYKIFVPLIKRESNNKEQEELMLYIFNKKQVVAQCKRTREGFVVLKGSKIRMKNNKSLSDTTKAMQKKCVENEEIVNGILKIDILRNSPSAAADFVLSRSAIGKDVLKTKEGLSLNDLEEKEFAPLIKKELNNKEQEELILYISAKRKGADKSTKGKCKRTNEGFVVLAGSMIEENYTESTPNSVRLLKEKCIEDNEIVDRILQKDKLFSSPSYAASFVLGRSINGKELWKTKEGLSLNALEKRDGIV